MYAEHHFLYFNTITTLMKRHHDVDSPILDIITISHSGKVLAIFKTGNGKSGNRGNHKLKRGDRRVRIFSAHNNWWVTPIDIGDIDC